MRNLLVALILLSSPAAYAGQTLIPSPYPTGVTGAEPLDPEPGRIGGQQTIMRDPYPQATGEFSQGNPPISRLHGRQRLVPSIYKRKYRVERHGGAR